MPWNALSFKAGGLVSWNTLLFKAVRAYALMNALTIQYPVRASVL